MFDVYVCPDCGEMFHVDMNTPVGFCPHCFSIDVEFDERIDNDDDTLLLRMQANHDLVKEDDEIVYEWES